MKINNTDVSAFNAKQFNFQYEHNALTNDSEWPPGAVTPYLSKNSVGFAVFTVTLVVKGAGREEIRRNCSSILSLLTGPVDLTLDGFSQTKFRGILTGHTEEERSLRAYHLLRLTFNGYEYGEAVTVTGASSLTVNNPGNIISPGIVTITPRIGAASIQLTGICLDPVTGVDQPVTISTITNGKVIVLDGITGLITEDGAAKEAEMWTLPAFKSGSTTVTCNNSNMDIAVEVLPLYI